VIDVGETAPDFELPDQDGEPVSLSSLRGRRVVLSFYPKAVTPGCTVQACGVRDHRADYEDAETVVLGISPDPMERVKNFHDGQGLNFTLLADEDHAVCEAYGVWVEKSMYDKKYWGARANHLRARRGRQGRDRAAQGQAGRARRARARGVVGLARATSTKCPGAKRSPM
jgi:peroxiredoxin Q/BCP